MITKKGALRAYRKMKRLSTGDIAKVLGVAASTVRSWENGSREMQAEDAVKIEREFGINRIVLRPDLFRLT